MTRTLSTAILLTALTFACPAAHAEIKGDAIRIGVLTDMNGIFATAMGPGSVEAARMAAEEFGGKINGKPIEILQADHQNKPDLAASLARKWFSDGVQAIADGGSSGAALAVQELVRGNGKIFLVSGAGANQLTDEACAPTSVQWTQDAYSTATAVVSGIMQTSKEPWFFITGDYAFGHSIEATARARIGELGGKVAGSVKAQLGTPDFSSFLLQAQSSGARILAINVAGDNATAIKQAEEFGLADQGIKIVPMS
ncbi:MAG: ABC transporter substrate-binding protein, partial [Bradyrhizobiaceae bacterium]